MNNIAGVISDLCEQLATEIEASYGPGSLDQCRDTYVSLRQAQIILRSMNSDLTEQTMNILKKIEDAMRSSSYSTCPACQSLILDDKCLICGHE